MLSELAASLPDSSVRDRLQAYSLLSPQAGIADAALQFGASGHVVESVPLALFAARQVTARGFSEMLGQLISTGGGTDTNASLAC